MRKFTSFAPVLLTAFLICLPLLTLAAPSDVPVAPAGYSDVPVAPSGSGYSVDNPLKVKNFCSLIKIVLEALLVIGLPVAAVFLVIVGFKYILAQGKPDAIKNANKNFMFTVIGIAIFIGAWAIAMIIARTMEQLGVGGLESCR